VALHRVLLEDVETLRAGDALAVEGEEASHAAGSKRIEVGERVEVLTGAGVVATAEVTGVHRAKRQARLELRVLEARAVARATPALHVWASVPKGDRAGWMIDQLAQLGAASWRALDSERAIAEAGDHKLARLARIAGEACKQCGRAWRMDLLPARTVDDACALARSGAPVWVADAAGEPIGAGAPPAELTVLIGPEGGLSPAELTRLREAGARAVRAGPHVLRIETAACAIAALLMGR
jgi:16S rRNA (uracil1498-N3)-methyltransferase